MGNIDPGFESSMTAFEIGERLGITPESAQHVMEELAERDTAWWRRCGGKIPSEKYQTDDEYFAAVRHLYLQMSDTRGT